METGRRQTSWLSTSVTDRGVGKGVTINYSRRYSITTRVAHCFPVASLQCLIGYQRVVSRSLAGDSPPPPNACIGRKRIVEYATCGCVFFWKN